MSVCKQCGGTEFYKCGICKNCQRERNKKRRDLNLESDKETRRKWREQNKEKVDLWNKASKIKSKEKRKISDAIRYEKNKEKIKLKKKEYYKNNIEKERNRNKRYREANPEKIKQYQKENAHKQNEYSRNYKLRNPDRAKITNNNRRSRIKNNGGVLSINLCEKLIKLQKGKCVCCGLPLGDDYHMDHIIPLSMGGVNEDSNIQLLRKQCNLSKGAKHPIEYMQNKGFLC